MINNSKPNLFVIEDNRLSQLILGSIINENSIYDVYNFESCENCIDKAKVNPDLILLDYNLDGMNGQQAIPCLKHKWRGAQIIMVSSEKNPDIIRHLLESDIVDFIEKDEDIEQSLNLAIVRAEKRIKKS